jgi:hypothetical protein
MNSLRTILRLLTGRIAYERRCAIRAAEMAAAKGIFDPEEAAAIMAFLKGAY